MEIIIDKLSNELKHEYFVLGNIPPKTTKEKDFKLMCDLAYNKCLDIGIEYNEPLRWRKITNPYKKK